MSKDVANAIAAMTVVAPWSEVARAWRRRSTTMVERGMPMADGRASLDMDDVLRITQEEVWREFGLPEVSQETQQQLVRAWRQLVGEVDDIRADEVSRIRRCAG